MEGMHMPKYIRYIIIVLIVWYIAWILISSQTIR